MGKKKRDLALSFMVGLHSPDDPRGNVEKMGTVTSASPPTMAWSQFFPRLRLLAHVLTMAQDGPQEPMPKNSTS